VSGCHSPGNHLQGGGVPIYSAAPVPSHGVWPNPNARTGPRPPYPLARICFSTQQERHYYYDTGAIGKPAVSDHPSANRSVWQARRTHGKNTFWRDVGGRRHRRDVWREPTTEVRDFPYRTRPSLAFWRARAPATWYSAHSTARVGSEVYDACRGAGLGSSWQLNMSRLPCALRA
jgi:hypothetical protein